MTEKEFKALKEHIDKRIAFDMTKINSQLLDGPIFYSTLLQLFVKENKNLNLLEQEKDELYASLYRHFKYDSDVRWETKHEIETQMYTTKPYIAILSKIEDQQEIVTYLQQQLENVKSLSFAIKNYIDWQKFVSGAS